MHLDAMARERVLANIREATPSRWTAKVDELRGLTRDGTHVSLARFLEETGLDLEDVYAGSKSWSDLLADAGQPTLEAGPHEVALRRACGRLLHMDDLERLETYQRLLREPSPPDLEALGPRERRLVRMLVAPMVDRVIDKATTLGQACALLWRHSQLLFELRELLDVLVTRIGHIHHALGRHPDVPLQVHARYTRVEILAALGVGEGAKVAPWQTGVYWAEDAGVDLLAFTLDKTSGQFSPTTRYRDYAISRELVHWESQGATREASETGQRYQHHVARGTSILLFARLRTDDRAFWCLGPATYVKHESELPMAVTWRLAFPLPGDLFATFAAAVA
jgi:hypothetical protein